jgi:hypothetical protein
MVFHRGSGDLISMRSMASADQVEQMLQATVFRRMQAYMYRLTDNRAGQANCLDSNMAAANRWANLWTTKTTSGIRLVPLDGPRRAGMLGAIAGGDALGQTMRLALLANRCGSATDVTGANMSNVRGIYFCLGIESSGGADIPESNPRRGGGSGALFPLRLRELTPTPRRIQGPSPDRVAAGVGAQARGPRDPRAPSGI